MYGKCSVKENYCLGRQIVYKSAVAVPYVEVVCLNHREEPALTWQRAQLVFCFTSS
jgi:hypothetical protein